MTDADINHTFTITSFTMTLEDGSFYVIKEGYDPESGDVHIMSVLHNSAEIYENERTRIIEIFEKNRRLNNL